MKKLFKFLFVSISIVVSILPTSTFAKVKLSKAANWLVGQAIKEGCSGRGGKFGSNGIFIDDFDGDGRDDLILVHSAISCNREWRMSDFCGAAACKGDLYLRRGKLLKHNFSFYGEVELRNANRPVISIYGKTEFRKLRWNGRKFAKM